MIETACQPQGRQRILHVPTAEQKDAMFRRHPFLSRFSTKRRNKVGEWLMVLAEREKLVSAFVPCIVNKAARDEASFLLRFLVANPSPETMDEFIEATRAKAEERGIQADGLRQKSILERIMRGPPDAVDIQLLIDVLRANGIFFDRYKFDKLFTADIVRYAPFPFLARPAAYVVDVDSMSFFGKTSPLVFFSMPPAWAYAHSHYFVMTSGQGYGSEPLLPEAIQHEAQHIFDMRAEIIFENVEYTAYLAGFAFAPKVRIDVWIPCEEPHHSASVRIQDELLALFDFNGNVLRLRSVSSGQLNAAAHALLNIAYKTQIGFTYDELVAPFRDV